MLSTGGLAQRIIDQGILNLSEMQKVLEEAKNDGHSLITHISQKELVNSKVLAQLVADEFGLPLIDINNFDLEESPKDSISNKLISQYSVLPLHKRGNRLFIAMADPTNTAAISDIKFHTGLNIESIIADKAALDKAVNNIANTADEMFTDDASLGELGSELEDAYATGEEENLDEASKDPNDDAPIVRFVHKILFDAIRAGASDIHFEPYEKSYRVRFRTDGILQEVASPPSQLAQRISARLKIISSLDISERRRPQDGRIKLRLSKNKNIDFRVNTLPTLWGEKIVLRILDSSSAQIGIDALGYKEEQKALYLEKLKQPQGLILVTGPTGSGKTVSLYTGLNILNTPQLNISTAEDPVEINLEGINQVQVNSKIGFEFTDALRSFLRQDPDIIMVGEIRDLPTAEIAIKAAQTGHLVLSTLHTNSAAETINRLMNMGVPPFNLATAVTLIIAQRLARTLCTLCAQDIEVPNDILLEEGYLEAELGELNLKKAVGCEKCNDGYKGRTGIFEVVEITDSISDMIMNNANSIELDKQIRSEGFSSLRRSALDKAKEGIISLEEVNRVTQDYSAVTLTTTTQ